MFCHKMKGIQKAKGMHTMMLHSQELLPDLDYNTQNY